MTLDDFTYLNDQISYTCTKAPLGMTRRWRNDLQLSVQSPQQRCTKLFGFQQGLRPGTPGAWGPCRDRATPGLVGDENIPTSHGLMMIHYQIFIPDDIIPNTRLIIIDYLQSGIEPLITTPHLLDGWETPFVAPWPAPHFIRNIWGIWRPQTLRIAPSKLLDSN